MKLLILLPIILLLAHVVNGAVVRENQEQLRYARSDSSSDSDSDSSSSNEQIHVPQLGFGRPNLHLHHHKHHKHGDGADTGHILASWHHGDGHDKSSSSESQEGSILEKCTCQGTRTTSKPFPAIWNQFQTTVPTTSSGTASTTTSTMSSTISTTPTTTSSTSRTGTPTSSTATTPLGANNTRRTIPTTATRGKRSYYDAGHVTYSGFRLKGQHECFCPELLIHQDVTAPAMDG